ncbi:ribonuclease PH [Verrucomicrobium sp. GAS474]|uniref:ribonuclease PH n=1 Tax=Verrucomicrobium sp. GAS474 TaxID=1882831 RepID=UPI00087AD674|nr:ribonuclease PH [Verrucomicrobium sp. GAS474]SDU20048.1 ribonuclease PH [Verrucomicrobium sp. GAS474]
MSTRTDGRAPGELRPYSFTPDFARNATGSVLATCGRTQVICAATIQEEVPRWMKVQGVTGGWITAEYSMLPYSTLDRKARDISKGRLDGRSVEIQRLIGRSMRAIIDLDQLGARTLTIDCDVLRADGGTRTTAITGAYVAVARAIRRLQAEGTLPAKATPIKTQVAAVSAGVVFDKILVDLDYEEDRTAAVDANIVMTSEGKFVEVQAAGEENVFSQDELQGLLGGAKEALAKLFELQREAVLY